MKIANTYHLGIPAFDTEGDLMAVLTGEPGDYAVYIGIVKLDADAHPAERFKMAERVAARGSKCNLRQARGYFPALTEENYRH